MTNLEGLKLIYIALGGEAEAAETLSNNADALAAIALIVPDALNKEPAADDGEGE